MEMEVAGARFYFLPRHGAGHAITPSEINYRANIFALKSLGVDTVVSISAVGSLQEQYAPRDFVLPDQFIDWTKGLRKRSFFDEGMVGHVSVAYPIEKGLQARIHNSCKRVGVKSHFGGSYVCIEGPQFSTRAESQIYRSFGASVIGMTNVPEAFLAKEAGIAYATVAMVTDYDCWKEEHCEVQEIMNVMKDNYLSAQKLIGDLIPELVNNPVVFLPENKFSVVTDSNKLTDRHKKILEVILK
jgi:5'-methylthioadenosine phosphorylase